MMGIVVPETCSAYKKYNKIISGIYFVFILQYITLFAEWEQKQGERNKDTKNERTWGSVTFIRHIYSFQKHVQ